MGFIIRNVKPEEFQKLGQLLVDVYSQLEGFPKPEEQPAYYNLLLNVGDFTQKDKTELIGAFNEIDELLAGVVFLGDMQYYGSGGTATSEKNSAGFRLLAVRDSARGLGLGKLLTLKCIEKAKEMNLDQVIIHTTMAMKPAWGMYEKIGFKRSEDLDFMQGNLEVFGFRYRF
ncbi:GNAT family N-acetyltransferase [Flavobacterium amniphilum]|uniref:GNAT family N-acetyltransferase n=1 Tax=Flavobacterium amniphilum TaxID=1834035 RepID=UPI00202AAD65|nr:GNAT family N-acetyltransferase [Flavobacterium amniphilum]MCL9804291.1 GNAT family N-acetyltransferase [Flavobacterium amniphilum]